MSNEKYDQASSLRNQVEQTKKNKMTELPPRSEIHARKKGKTNWKLSFSFVRIFLLILFLAMIILFIFVFQ